MKILSKEDLDYFETQAEVIGNKLLSDEDREHIYVKSGIYSDVEDERFTKRVLCAFYISYYRMHDDTHAETYLFFINKAKENSCIGYVVSALNWNPSKINSKAYASYKYDENDKKFIRTGLYVVNRI